MRAQKRPLVQFAPQMAENNRVLQAFLSTRMYRHARVLEIMDRARRVVRDLFEAYMNDASLLPDDWREENAPATAATMPARSATFSPA